jgi:dihydrofolate reductase
MARLIYFTPTSLDGFLAGENEDLDWAVPDEAVSTLINDQLRSSGTYLYGRRIYETMKVWETPEVMPGLTPAMREFARLWQAADKIVYSRTLSTVSTPRTRLEREFEPEAVRRMKARSPHDISVDGANLSAQAIRAGLVDEIQLLVVPVLLGGGKRVLPADVRIRLELLEQRGVGEGWVFLRYRSRA